MALRLASASPAIGETPAQSEGSVRAATRTCRFGNSDGNQQRRLRLDPEAKLSARSSALETAIQNKDKDNDKKKDKDNREGIRAQSRKLLTGFRPARTIAMRTPAAARIERSAVIGP